MSNREARIGSINPDQGVKRPDNQLAQLTRFGLTGDILSLIEDGWKFDILDSIDSDYNPALRVIDPSVEMTFVRLMRNEGDRARAESVVITFTEDGRVFICGRELTFGAKLLQTDNPDVNAVQQAFVKKGLSAAVENPLSHAAVEHKRKVGKVYLWDKKRL